MQIKTSKPKKIWNAKTNLGEGILWVRSKQSIFFVDIKKKKILIFNIQTKKKTIIKVEKEVSFIVHVKKNIFLLGLQSELRIVDIKTKKIFKSIKIEKNLPYNRTNDGKIDTKGRLWFGTMDNFERNIRNGSLYCLDKKLNLHKIDTKYIITNGPAFINSNNFYHTDSRKKIIYKMKINKNFKLIEKKIFLKFNKLLGSPDGMTVDINKNLWVCHYGGASISVYNQKGKMIHLIKFPAKNITNCTFGGPRNNDLYVTTALKKLSKYDIKNYSLSGALFKIKTNTKGLTSKKFNVL